MPLDTWGVDPAATNLVVTEPVLSPVSLQHAYHELLSTTAVPIIAGRIVRHAVRRLPVAGRVLTNALNDLLSLRHVHLLDDAPAARAP
ncbi:hypothetical protein CXG81DRAFT_24289 [Caulochytrium protostelioides]|uniref:Uncharacterized protein n=1 Tax=Caulochytrium protostelioides TaxID=1555241 RepID=A0A4P9XCB1_9FUNG|nr:hypothetical protein CXG81DRAFT_24289 [Caulochytrium protostelioides]|eukprot:RKP03084.1 hypothetical protein CXG81DRAFT_24289 [Caulochytrium protostelioides]